MATILVVEDEVVLGKSIARYLTNVGHACAVVTSVEMGLKRLEEIEPDLMLLDIRLQGADGLESLPRIMALRPKLRVVMMTAYGTIETAVQAMKAGACDFICKPFDLDVLREVVDGALTSTLPLSSRLRTQPPSDNRWKLPEDARDPQVDRASRTNRTE